MDKPIHGFIRGNSIELPANHGMAEGQEVEVHVRGSGPREEWGAGIRRTAGALADDTQWDQIMTEIQEARKEHRATESEEP